MPAGMAIAMASAPLVLPWTGWRGLWLLHAGLTAVVLVIVLIATRGVSGRASAPRRISTEALRRPGPWLLAAAFACYAVQFFAVTTWMPTFLVESHGTTREAAALAGALVVAANIVGCLAGAWLLHREVARWKLLAVTFLVMAPCAAGAFSAALSPVPTVVLAAIFSAVGGLLPAAVLAGTAAHAPTRDHVATVNGFVVQGSHVGVVVGAAGLRIVRRRFRGLGAGLDTDGGAGNRRARSDGGDPDGGAEGGLGRASMMFPTEGLTMRVSFPASRRDSLHPREDGPC